MDSALGSERCGETQAALVKATVELGTIGSVLETLQRQVAEVSSDVETSLLGVSKGFQGLAQRAQSAVIAASARSEGAYVQADGELIEEMRKVVQLLLEQMENSGEYTAEIASRLAQIEQRLDRVNQTLSDIEEIAKRARVVALNGQIEATRAGAAGCAFQVVAEETKVLSNHAAETSTSIRGLVAKLTSDILETSMDLRQRSENDVDRLSRARVDATRLLLEIDSSQRRLSESLASTAEISRDLKGDITRAVVSLQFQDRVSQRLGHVSDSLSKLATRVDAFVGVDLEREVMQSSKALMSELASHFTMDSERRAAIGVGLENEFKSTENEMEVELF